MNHNILLFLTIATFVFAIMVVVYSYIAKPKVIEWRLDPPDGEHLMLPSAEPTEEEQATIDHQKRAEILYHALMYNNGMVTTTALFKIIQERWNKKLEPWPQYKLWKIAHQWLLTNVAQMDYENSGEVFKLVEGNSAGAMPGYYVLVSPPDPNGRGRKLARQLVPVSELVELWRVAKMPPPPATTTAAENAPGSDEVTTNGIQDAIDQLPPLYEEDEILLDMPEVEPA